MDTDSGSDGGSREPERRRRRRWSRPGVEQDASLRRALAVGDHPGKRIRPERGRRGGGVRRGIGLMFDFIILPITFLGGTYYSWTKLAPVTVGGWHWLQVVVLINPLIYVNEGTRCVHHRIAHAPVRDLPGGDRVRRAVPVDRAAQLPAARAFLIRLVSRLWSAVHGNRDLRCRKPGGCNDLRSRHGRLVGSVGLTCRHTL